MIKYCLTKWDKNRDKLMAALKKDKTLDSCGYKHLVEMVVRHILNDDEYLRWSEAKITEIDNGEYQGTLLYMIPKNSYQPSEAEYLMTFVTYGSCSGCDTLQRIQSPFETTKSEIPNECFKLCRDLVANIVKPYNAGWRYDECFEPVKMDETDDMDEMKEDA